MSAPWVRPSPERLAELAAQHARERADLEASSSAALRRRALAAGNGHATVKA